MERKNINVKSISIPMDGRECIYLGRKGRNGRDGKEKGREGKIENAKSIPMRGNGRKGMYISRKEGKLLCKFLLRFPY